MLSVSFHCFGWQWQSSSANGETHRAFSQLVADNQYATLGLMLMGCLARLYKVLGTLRVLSAEEIAEKAGTVKETVKVNDEPEVGEDLGERIVRDAPVSGVTENSTQVEKEANDDTEVNISKQKKRKPEGEGSDKMISKLPSLDSTPVKPPKKKRKKKGGDAFDDLFDGLI